MPSAKGDQKIGRLLTLIKEELKLLVDELREFQCEQDDIEVKPQFLEHPKFIVVFHL